MELADHPVDGVYTVDVADSVVITFRLSGDKASKLRQILDEKEPALPGMPKPSIHHLARAMVLEGIDGEDRALKRIKDLESQVNDLRDKWLRSVAAIEKYKKRIKSEGGK